MATISLDSPNTLWKTLVEAIGRDNLVLRAADLQRQLDPENVRCGGRERAVIAFPSIIQ
jgi:hypothetical protein